MIHHEIKIKKKKKKGTSRSKTSFQRSYSRRRQQSFQIEERAANGAIPSAANKASRSKNELPDWIVAVDADFDASARSLLWMPILTLRPDRKKAVDADDSSDEENESVVELFGVWSKIDADDLSAWVGGGWRVSDRWEKNKKERILNRKKAKRRREKERKVERKGKKEKKRKKRESDWWDVRFGAYNLQLFTNMPPNIRFWVMKTGETCFHFLSSSLIFLSDGITKTGSPNMSDESKRNVLCGSHQFWMMSDENRIISLKIACIQTTSKPSTHNKNK